MQKMVDVVMNMIYPDYTVPNMADTRAASWTERVLTRNLTNYMALFPRQRGAGMDGDRRCSGNDSRDECEVLP